MKRNLLTVLAALVAWPLAAQTGSTLYHNNQVEGRTESMNLKPEWAPFFHGVASGDPLQDRVIIWTRITPEDMSGDPIELAWKVATDVDLTNVVKQGTFVTDAARDYTVKVDVTGLQTGTTYYYGFSHDGKNSLTGKTKTAPAGDQSAHLKFGVVSCSNYQAGYFNGYQRLAERNDLDAVIHLGDYIYEYADGVYGDSTLFDERALEPATEIVSLADYRARYSTYRLDSMLARVHQQHPFITVWDDHESANDSWTDGAQNHDPSEGAWEDRLAAAKQAYFEWMPIRDNQDNRVYRKISYGNLLDLILLDTRLEGREQQIDDITDTALVSPTRTLLGTAQKQWLKDQLNGSNAQWKVIAQQVIFAPFEFGWAAAIDPTGQSTYEELESLFLDIWDGYPAERAELINFLDDHNMDNVVILTGDFHTTFCFDVTEEPKTTTL